MGLTNMNEIASLRVQARIRSCLDLILELEDTLTELPQGDNFLSDFEQLKKATHNLQLLDAKEEDARRIENATTLLLEELQIPLSLSKNSSQIPY